MSYVSFLGADKAAGHAQFLVFFELISLELCSEANERQLRVAHWSDTGSCWLEALGQREVARRASGAVDGWKI